MNCSECRDLYRIFERRNTRYLEARSAAFFQISTRIAARKHVDLQRAVSDLQEHQAECPWAKALVAKGQTIDLPAPRSTSLGSTWLGATKHSEGSSDECSSLS